MQVKQVADLAYGDRFIWLDDETRRNMAVHFDRDRLQVLKLVDMDSEKITYETLAGVRDILYYLSSSMVIIIPDDSGIMNVSAIDMNFAVRCSQCKKNYGSHYTGKGSWTDGICCGEARSGKWFVPLEEDLRKYHPEVFDVEDFFASLGL